MSSSDGKSDQLSVLRAVLVLVTESFAGSAGARLATRTGSEAAPHNLS